MSMLDNLNGPGAPDASQAEYLKQEQKAAAELQRIQTKNAKELHDLRLSLVKKLNEEALKQGKRTEEYLASYGLDLRLSAIDDEYKERLEKEKQFIEEIKKLVEPDKKAAEDEEEKKRQESLKQIEEEGKARKKILSDLATQEAGGATRVAKQGVEAGAKLSAALEASTKAQLAELEKATKASIEAITKATPETAEVERPAASFEPTLEVGEVAEQEAKLKLTPIIGDIGDLSADITLNPIVGEIAKQTAEVTLTPILENLEPQAADLTLTPKVEDLPELAGEAKLAPVVDELPDQSGNLNLTPVLGELPELDSQTAELRLKPLIAEELPEQSAELALTPKVGDIAGQEAKLALTPEVGEIEEQSAALRLKPIVEEPVDLEAGVKLTPEITGLDDLTADVKLNVETPEIPELETLVSVLPVVEPLDELEGLAKITPVVDDIKELTGEVKLTPDVEDLPDLEALARIVPVVEEAPTIESLETTVKLTPEVGPLETLETLADVVPVVQPIEGLRIEADVVLNNSDGLKTLSEAAAAEEALAGRRLDGLDSAISTEQEIAAFRLSTEDSIAVARLSAMDLLLLREKELKAAANTESKKEDTAPAADSLKAGVDNTKTKAAPPPTPLPSASGSGASDPAEPPIDDFDEAAFAEAPPVPPPPPPPPPPPLPSAEEPPPNNATTKGKDDPNAVKRITAKDVDMEQVLALAELEAKTHNEAIERDNELLRTRRKSRDNYLLSYGISVEQLRLLDAKSNKELMEQAQAQQDAKLEGLKAEIEAEKQAAIEKARLARQVEAEKSGAAFDDEAFKLEAEQIEAAYDMRAAEDIRLANEKFDLEKENLQKAYKARGKADEVAERQVAKLREQNARADRKAREAFAKEEATKWLEDRKKSLKEANKFSEKFQKSKVGQFKETMSSHIDAKAMEEDLKAQGVSDEEAHKAAEKAAQEELDSKFEALGNIINELAGLGKEAVNHMTPVDVRLQGLSTKESEGGMKKILGSYWRKIESDISRGIGASPFILQKDVMQSVEDLVKQGIAFNVEERAFLNTLKDKIAATFDATDSTLLKLVRIQQADTTAARLGMESMLTAFLNSMYATSEYMSESARAVRESLFAATSLMEAKSASEFEYVVQKWLGSLHSVGFTAAESIADVLGKLSAGDIEPLTSDSGVGRLLLMAANDASISITEVLEKGLSTKQTDTLLAQTVKYLAKIHEDTKDSRVLAQQYASVFGVSATDLRAAATLAPSIEAISKHTVDVDAALNRVYDMSSIIQLGLKTSMGDMFENAVENFKFTFASTLANNPVLSGLNLMANMLNDLVGGIEIPFINVYGFGFDLNATIADLMNVAALSGTVLGGAAKMLASLASGGGAGPGMLKVFGVDKGAGNLDVLTRGKAAGTTASSGGSTSESGFIGNENSDDIVSKTEQDASEGPSKQVAEAKEDQEAKEDARTQLIVDQIVNIYDLLQDVVLGSKKFHVQLEVGNAPLTWQSTSWYN